MGRVESGEGVLYLEGVNHLGRNPRKEGSKTQTGERLLGVGEGGD